MEVIPGEYAQEYGVTLEYKNIKDRLIELLKKISRKHGQKCVVLVDEYDKPILDNIERRDVAMELREELKNIYSVLKDADPYLKFVFITGVSKFSKVSIFSGLNNLEDITLNPSYATLCGYTQGELEHVFQDALEGVDLSEVRRWYNGYNFLGETVYNPFDVLLFLKERRFRPYWFERGTPTVLIKLLAEGRYLVPELEGLETSERIMGSFEIERIEVETLLFQTGYLTIRSVERKGGKDVYSPGYPNLEVKMSLTDYIPGLLCAKRDTKGKDHCPLLQGP